MSFWGTKKSLKVIFVLLVITIAALCILFIDFDKEQSATDFVEFIDVGQGDSAIIMSGDTVALIDAGTPTSSTAISKALRKHNIGRLDVMVLSHAHDDHIGSADYILQEFGADNLVLPAVLPNDDENATSFKDIKDTADYLNTECHTAQEGMVINIGNFKLTVLMCETEVEDENDSSIILMVQNGSKRFLFTGDAEEYCENKLLSQGVDLKSDVLKVAHHGSNSSTTSEFLSAVHPQYSVISVGESNRYGHPTGKVLDRLRMNGTKVLRTDKNGNIIFYVNNDNIVLEK